jgi:hypothetical protein
VPEPIGWDTALRAMQDSYERLQHRKDADLPPLPVELTRGVVGSVIDPLAVHPTVIEPSGPPPPTPAEQVSGISGQLLEQARRDHPEFYRLDTEPTEDPVLARLRAWRLERGT